MMERKRLILSPLVAGMALISFAGQWTCGAQTSQRQNSQTAVKAQDKQLDKQLLARFDQSIKNYVKQRNQVKEKLPKLSKDSTPEQIQANESAFVAALRAARTNAKSGAIFSEEVVNYIRSIVRSEFKGKDRRDVKETILEADTREFRLR